jgi:NADPH2:quinone reductase
VKAACYDTTGPAREVLHLRELDRPEPGPGQVRVRVHRSGINPTDVKARAGFTPRPIDDFQIPHQDGSGTIDAVGAGVDPTRVGQRVWLYLAAATQRWGTAAEWTVVDQRQAVPLPDSASFELGACLGVPAVTAHHCLFADGPLTGRTVLVAGGAGSVGHFAIELAKWAGATVVSTVSGPSKAELARQAGADMVVNYRDPDVVEQITRFTPRVDRVVEVDLAANLELDLALAGPGTTVITYATTGKPVELSVRACMTANVSLSFVLLYTISDEALAAATAGVAAALRDDAITALPVHSFGLDDVAAAHETVESGAAGKVLLQVTDD